MNRSATESPTCAIGIDIGGTKMAVGLVTSCGQIVDSQVIATEAEQGFTRAVDRLGRAIEALWNKSGLEKLAGIGIGCAGPLDPQRGLINNPYTLTGWDQCDIVTPLHTRFGIPVYLENDADVAALGECACGAGSGFNPVVMLTFGTGIGGAAIVGGKIYRGVNGEHPELGHIAVGESGPDCYCGTRGCLEALASGTAIAAAGQHAGLLGTRAVFAAAAQSHAVAAGIIERAVAAAATGAWTLCHTFLPERLVLGGGVMEEHFDLFATALRRRLATATQFSRGAVEVVQATLGNDAGLVGAAQLAISTVAR